jgi:hypothetical protein
VRHEDELLRVLHREQLQKKLMDEREHGGIRADPDGERRHRDQAKQGRAP